MSWSGFRPSDDATKYGYNIPGNMYAVAALERAVQLNADVWQDADFERAASQLVTAMRYVSSYRCSKQIAGHSSFFATYRSAAAFGHSVSVQCNPRCC